MATDYTKQPTGGTRAIGLEILSGATNSDSLKLNGQIPVALVIPVAPTGASFTFQGALDHAPTTFYTLKDNLGANLTLTTSAGAGYYKLNPADFDGVEIFRAVSASAEAATRSMFLIVSNYKS